MAIPDSPARAIRLNRSSVALIAAHYNNIFTESSSLSGPFRPQCSVMSEGRQNGDPAAFDDRWWIQAVAFASNGDMIALASHEYRGGRHAGACDIQGRGCWYSSIVIARGNRDLHFDLLPMNERILARPSSPYDRGANERVGYLTVSNILKKDGEFYAFVYGERTGEMRQGNCLVRSNDLLHWRAFDGSDFNADLSQTDGCSPIAPSILSAPVRSVLRLETHNIWISIFFDKRKNAEGVWYSKSADLLTWSEPELLLEAKQVVPKRLCTDFFAYPSAIDRNSPSPIFDTAGADFDLYMTRFNFSDCKRDQRKRDLVRYKVHVEDQ